MAPHSTPRPPVAPQVPPQHPAVPCSTHCIPSTPPALLQPPSPPCSPPALLQPLPSRCTPITPLHPIAPPAPSQPHPQPPQSHPHPRPPPSSCPPAPPPGPPPAVKVKGSCARAAVRPMNPPSWRHQPRCTPRASAARHPSEQYSTARHCGLGGDVSTPPAHLNLPPPHPPAPHHTPKPLCATTRPSEQPGTARHCGPGGGGGGSALGGPWNPLCTPPALCIPSHPKALPAAQCTPTPLHLPGTPPPLWCPPAPQSPPNAPPTCAPLLPPPPPLTMAAGSWRAPCKRGRGGSAARGCRGWGGAPSPAGGSPPASPPGVRRLAAGHWGGAQGGMGCHRGDAPRGGLSPGG